MKYNVHCYEIVRVMFEDIEADSPQEAADAARRMAETVLSPIINRFAKPEIECMLECIGFIVDPLDVLGQIDYDNSLFLNHDMEDINAASKEETGEEA